MNRTLDVVADFGQRHQLGEFANGRFQGRVRGWGTTRHLSDPLSQVGHHFPDHFEPRDHAAACDVFASMPQAEQGAIRQSRRECYACFGESVKTEASVAKSSMNRKY